MDKTKKLKHNENMVNNFIITETDDQCPVRLKVVHLTSKLKDDKAYKRYNVLWVNRNFRSKYEGFGNREWFDDEFKSSREFTDQKQSELYLEGIIDAIEFFGIKRCNIPKKDDKKKYNLEELK